MPKNTLPSETRVSRFHAGPEGRKEFEKWMKTQPPETQEAWQEMNDKYGDVVKDQNKTATPSYVGDSVLQNELSEEAMYAEGEKVPLKDLPQELQDNVTNPPPAVQKLKTEMEEESMMEKEGPPLLPVELAQMRAAALRQAMNRRQASGARDRLTWQKEAASGLYGYTVQTQRDVEASVRKVQKQALKLAKRIYAKDAGVVSFLQEHSKRAKSSSAKLLLAAMKNIGPKLASETKTATDQMEIADILEIYLRSGQTYTYDEIAGIAGQEAGRGVGHFVEPAIEILLEEGILDRRGRGYIRKASEKTARTAGGLYGHPTKTAQLGLSACTEFRVFAGEVAAGLHSRRTARYAKITGFLQEHSKQGKCGYSKMILGCYPAVSTGKQAGGAKSSDFQVGDRVLYWVHGKGTVTEAWSQGGKTGLTIEWDSGDVSHPQDRSRLMSDLQKAASADKKGSGKTAISENALERVLNQWFSRNLEHASLDDVAEAQQNFIDAVSQEEDMAREQNERFAGCEKLPEGGMRDNCEKKKEEGKKEADFDPKDIGKTVPGPLVQDPANPMPPGEFNSEDSSEFQDKLAGGGTLEWQE